MDYTNWTTEDIITEIKFYQKHYSEYPNFKIKIILGMLRQELRKRNIFY